jgi:hypothetical protein
VSGSPSASGGVPGEIPGAHGTSPRISGLAYFYLAAIYPVLVTPPVLSAMHTDGLRYFCAVVAQLASRLGARFYPMVGSAYDCDSVGVPLHILRRS